MDKHNLTVEIISFSYKGGFPSETFSWAEGRHGGGYVFDCRLLPNPGREDRFKEQTGLDIGVVEYLEGNEAVKAFKEHVFSMVASSVKVYLERKFSYLSVAFGCTGGQHRSVYFADTLSKYLTDTFGEKVICKVRHVQLEKGRLPSTKDELK